MKVPTSDQKKFDTSFSDKRPGVRCMHQKTSKMRETTQTSSEKRQKGAATHYKVRQVTDADPQHAQARKVHNAMRSARLCSSSVDEKLFMCTILLPTSLRLPAI
eukprot:6213323-Pleurochrysis_carterae.AAC.1